MTTENDCLEDEINNEYFAVYENEKLCTKLQLLDYERNYVDKWRMKPISRVYFVFPVSAGEQFHQFISLAIWLCNESGSQYERHEESDDPKIAVGNVLKVLKENDDNLDIKPLPLLTGSGDTVIEVLTKLANLALKQHKFSWNLIDFEAMKQEELNEPQSEDEEEGEVDEEIDLDKMEEDIIYECEDDDDDENEEEMLNLAGIHKLSNESSKKKEEIMESKTDSTAWHHEVERVLPQLKVVRSTTKDWRSRLDLMGKHTGIIEEHLTKTKGNLFNLQTDIDDSMKKIQSIENTFNSSAEDSIQALQSRQEILNKSRQDCQLGSNTIVEKTRQLDSIREQIQIMEAESRETGAQISDGSPVVRLKKSLEQLRKEIAQMDLRIGVLEHLILRSKQRGHETTSE